MGRHCDIEKQWPDSKGPSAIATKFEIRELDYVSNVCPKPKVDGGVFYFLKLHQHYKNSVFPFSGGLLEQPQYYLSMMNLIDRAL